VPEQQDHGPRSDRNTWLHALWKSFILRVQGVLTRHTVRDKLKHVDFEIATLEQIDESPGPCR